MNPGGSHPIGDLKCPLCGCALQLARSLGEDVPPSAGDINLCINCGAILVFTDDQPLAVRLATDVEIRVMRDDPAIRWLLDTAQRAIRMRT